MIGNQRGAAAVRIVALGGSLDGSSNNLFALQAAGEAAVAAGASLQVLDLRALDLPLYAWGAAPPAGAVQLVEAVRAADGLLWASPLYHGTVSGAFKNAIDWLELLSADAPPYLSRKPVGLICTAGGQQGMQAINTMEYMVRALRGITCPFVVPIAEAHRAFDNDGQPKSDKLATQLGILGREVVELARTLRSPPAHGA